MRQGRTQQCERGVPGDGEEGSGGRGGMMGFYMIIIMFQLLLKRGKYVITIVSANCLFFWVKESHIVS